jgi:hypothetical protein
VIATLELRRVTLVPKELESGLLYVSERYRVAVHLCACGCGNKVVTPLGPAEWTFTEQGGRPTLRPSIGSWQLECRSHYCIVGGAVRWSGQWSPAQVEAGRRAEQANREAHYEQREQQLMEVREVQHAGWLLRLWRWLKNLFSAE